MYISESIGICLSRIYNVSLYVMDRIMPAEIQLDFLCYIYICLLNFTSFIGKCLSLAGEINISKYTTKEQ